LIFRKSKEEGGGRRSEGEQVLKIIKFLIAWIYLKEIAV